MPGSKQRVSPKQMSEERSVNTEPGPIAALEYNWKRKKAQLRDLATEIDMIKDRIAATEKVNEGLKTEID